MTVMVLGGPPAVGHNTIAEFLCSGPGTRVLIDLDDIREMARGAAGLPGDGGLGDGIYLASIDAGCALAIQFDRRGYDVVLLDVVPPDTLRQYRKALEGCSFTIVALMADEDQLIARDRGRDPDPNPDRAALAVWHDRIRLRVSR